MTDIVGPAAARMVLDALLPGIEASLAAVPAGATPTEKMAAMEAAKTRLRDFFNGTRPQNLADQAEVDAVRKIDGIAFDAFSNLTAQQVDLGVGTIKQASQQLQALTASLNQQTASTSSAARSVALLPVKKAVDAMTAMVNSVKALKNNLSSADPDQAKAATEIDALVAQFETLRKAVNKPSAGG